MTHKTPNFQKIDTQPIKNAGYLKVTGNYICYPLVKMASTSAAPTAAPVVLTRRTTKATTKKSKKAPTTTATPSAEPRDCLVCFCPIEPNEVSITCASPECTAHVCGDCAERYMEFAKTEKSMPTCPVQACRADFLYSEVKAKLPQSATRTFEETCMAYLDIHLEKQIQDLDRTKNLVSDFRNKRDEFIQQFPAGIGLLVKTAFPMKMRKIESDNLKREKKLLNSLAHKRCCNPLCDGTLNSDFECFKCGMKFCMQCERDLKPDSHTPHQCRQEDIDSLNFIKDCVECPTCKVPVLRSYGCNFITCARCKTNFDYNTGRRTLAGNHDDTSITWNISTKLMDTIGRRYDRTSPIHALLLQIQMAEPAYYQLSAKRFTQIKEDPKTIATQYEKHVRSKYHSRHYAKLLKLVQEKHDEGTLDEQFLTQIYQKMTA
jgi:hypothetical protein